ncbi:hypothetical protein HN371_10215 [Candidatus Poribacteria bacterium]|nr:hypothetical protein [Candidatus Poribacteria bacterium]MBT5536077.1 hypothetical protein [Candidatus Poribacteria bacterium]MBT5710266.1 hypothetical protein [Candidatus Poribacteria bacterium]MBT7096715.1 hypothetical protein [Candidatus Poribacteria bacterium]MBT7807285.1 hypothetical protein [Candidatus Poribacteria bacterium]
MGVYLRAFALFGSVRQGSSIARNVFVAEVAPDDHRPSDIAFLHTVSLSMASLSALAGWAIGRSTSGLDALFAAGSITGSLTLAAGSRLAEVLRSRRARRAG